MVIIGCNMYANRWFVSYRSCCSKVGVPRDKTLSHLMSTPDPCGTEHPVSCVRAHCSALAD